MQLVYDYYGLEICFGNEACLPIVVHGCRGHHSSSMRISFSNGLLNSPELLETEQPLDNEDLETFRLIVEKNASELIKQWLDVNLYGKTLEPEIIRQKISS